MLRELTTLVQEVALAVDLEDAMTRVVGGVRRAMGVDACAIFLRDTDGRHYVLRASDGLNPGAVGRVHLAHGKGLVGLVGTRREPVNVEDAPRHPSFVRYPEVGEDHLHAFLGVPVVHYGRLIGILTVQDRRRRVFDDDHEGFLLTVAAQIAASLREATLEKRVEAPGWAEGRPTVLEGAAGAPGLAVGTLVTATVYESLETVPDRGAFDPEGEERALRAAAAEVESAIRVRGARMAELLPAEGRAVFEAHALMAGDAELLSRTVVGIRHGQWAPAALREAVAGIAGEFEAMADPYLRSRAEDVRAVGRQILLQLQRKAPPARDYPPRTVLVGEEVGLDWLVEVPRDRLCAVVCLGSSAASHLAVVARALGIPAVMDVGRLPLASLDGRPVVVDGHRGRVVLEPSPATCRQMEQALRARAAVTAELEGLRDLPSVTADGVPVPVYVNAGLAGAGGDVLHAGAAGVGLCRTELQFMLRDAFPTEDEQYRAYRDLLEAFAPAPVAIRALDIGGDKQLPYFPIEGEENPALGWRGIRVLLRRRDLLLPQFRALLRANAGLGNLRILLPMVTGAREVREARRMLARARDSLSDGADAALPRLGAMVETPAAAYQVTALAREADFLTIGTNDLTQYLLAVDRSNSLVAGLYDHLHPAVLRVVRVATSAARRARIPIGVCGEMAGDPAGALLLLGLGVEYLSTAPPRVGPAKWVIRSFSRSEAARLLARALRAEDGRAVRRLAHRALTRRGLGTLLGPGSSTT